MAKADAPLVGPGVVQQPLQQQAMEAKAPTLVPGVQQQQEVVAKARPPPLPPPLRLLRSSLQQQPPRHLLCSNQLQSPTLVPSLVPILVPGVQQQQKVVVWKARPPPLPP